MGYGIGALLLYFVYVLMALIFKHKVALTIVILIGVLFCIGAFFYKGSMSYKFELFYGAFCSLAFCWLLAKRTETIRIKDEEKQKCDESIKDIAESGFSEQNDNRGASIDSKKECAVIDNKKNKEIVCNNKSNTVTDKNKSNNEELNVKNKNVEVSTNKGELKMLNLVGYDVLYKKDECVYKVIKQYDDKVVLNNGRTYQYLAMFQNAFTLIDEQKKKEMEEDIERIKNEEKIRAEKEGVLKTREREIESAKIRSMLSGIVPGHNISLEWATDISLSGKLEYGKIYGSKAFDIYSKACTFLDFDARKKFSFAPQRLLYATDCTKEGYSVWMVPNSELNGLTNGKWVNFVDLGNGTILQYTVDPNYLESAGHDIRLTFVKQKSGDYVFIGVYELVKFEKGYPEHGMMKETLKLISKDYPM